MHSVFCPKTASDPVIVKMPVFAAVAVAVLLLPLLSTQRNKFDCSTECVPAVPDSQSADNSQIEINLPRNEIKIMLGSLAVALQLKKKVKVQLPQQHAMLTHFKENEFFINPQHV